MFASTGSKLERINTLYEQLIYLDELAGELDSDSNQRIDAQRTQIVQELRRLGETC